PVGRALPDCEVVLHSSSRLSPIVAHEKRAYLVTYESAILPSVGRKPVMNDALDGIRAHYRATGLTDRLKSALAVFGSEDQRLTPQQLAPLDHFHTRGITASAELAKLAGITADMSVLDLGSGVGGPARLLAATTGCRVTGVDLSEPFVEAARYLTER